jgi:rhodanese-related sulfurtransferase/ubiquinone/menaquinone biosynthesis C-methylase UbiE
MELIRATGVPPDAAIIDVGGGASSLAAHLLGAGYSNLTVADISAAALEEARARLENSAGSIEWIVADVREHDFSRSFDLWHDRAAFHFMVEPEDRTAYMETLRGALRPGGFVVIATYGPDGPALCSGLPVHRYEEEELAAAFGGDFRVTSAQLVLHWGPSGDSRQYLYLVAQRSYETVDRLLDEARAGLERLSPAQADAACRAGATLVDIRSDAQRARDGVIPDAIYIPRNVLEWRCDPESPHRDKAVARRGQRLILICDEGYQSSLAAATLTRFGVSATDVAGGFQAWRNAGMRVDLRPD